MAKDTFHVMTCDRCRRVVECRKVGDDDGWGKMARSGHEHPADLCPGCVEALVAWWNEPQGPVDQPAAPPPTKAPVRKPYTLVERKRAVQVVAGALIDRADLTVKRLQDAGILPPIDVLGPIHDGCEEQAGVLVTGVAEILFLTGEGDA